VTQQHTPEDLNLQQTVLETKNLTKFKLLTNKLFGGGQNTMFMYNTVLNPGLNLKFLTGKC
jgi:hypothetical protein